MERPVVAVAAAAGRVARTYAAVAAVAALVVVLFLFRDGLPDRGGRLALALLAVALAAVPPVVLWLLAASLRALADLPARVRDLPAESRVRGDELRRLAGTARRARLIALPLVLWRLGRVAGSSQELLRPYAGALPLLSPPFLGLAALAAVAAAVEIGVAAVLLVVLAVR